MFSIVNTKLGPEVTVLGHLIFVESKGWTDIEKVTDFYREKSQDRKVSHQTPGRRTRAGTLTVSESETRSG